MRLILAFILFTTVARSQQRPNIIYIMSDDHDAKTISAYSKKFILTPNIDRIAREGIIFNQAFVGNSICSPARATLLTGQHSHKNGVKDNRTRFDSSKITLPRLFQEGGYQTAIVGKWHLHSYPAGFDYWKILPGQGQYFETTFINMQGDTSREHGYATNLITDAAINWLDNREKGKPFLLLLHHKAPHRNFFPPLKYIRQYQNKTFSEPATLYTDTTGHGAAWRLQTMSILHDMRLSSDLKVDPGYLMDIPGLMPDKNEIAYYNAVINRIPEPDRTEIKKLYQKRGQLLKRLKPSGKALLKNKYQWYMQDYLASVAAIDENIGRILDHLDKTGLSKNTVVIYTSDQGMYLGENGWFDKRFMYDVSMRTPLLVKGPGIREGKSESLVQNIDLAPTMLDLAGLSVPVWMQGESLLPLFNGTKKQLAREQLYYHYYEYGQDHTVIPHLGIRGKRYKLIYFYTANEWEFYDLQADPAEQRNLIKSPAHQEIITQYKQQLRRLRDLYDDHEQAGELH